MVAKTNVASTKTPMAGAEILLKTHHPSKSHKLNLNIMEDNASIDSYIFLEAVRYLNLQPVGEVMLEIKGINSKKGVTCIKSRHLQGNL